MDDFIKHARELALKEALIDKLLGEVDSLRKDASRYRWLREGHNQEAGHIVSGYAGLDLDRAIDSYMKERAE